VKLNPSLHCSMITKKFLICINHCRLKKCLILGIDHRSEACQRFYRDGLTTSFTKILTDEAVSGWKFEIHVGCICSKASFFVVILIICGKKSVIMI